jgi:hypothetical protein
MAAVSEMSRLRHAYNAVERRVAPRAEELVRTSEFAHAVAFAARVRRRLGGQVEAVTARLWHVANLPAGSDAQRLRVQIGQLDREVRRLRLQLAAQNQASAEGVSDGGAEPAEPA